MEPLYQEMAQPRRQAADRRRPQDDTKASPTNMASPALQPGLVCFGVATQSRQSTCGRVPRRGSPNEFGIARRGDTQSPLRRGASVSSYSRSARGNSDREPDRGGDAADFCRGRASLRASASRFSIRIFYPDQPVLGAGTVHLHVRVDGEVRRRLWRAHRHPCRRRRAGQSCSSPTPRR